jgi:DNA (cytosine-5)-methyltransferase 1
VRTLHLFAGVGGGLLCDLILGHEPVCAVEIDSYCCAVLRERVAEGWFPGLHVWEGDVRLWDPSEWAGRVDCIAAGFPCQDLSCAGRGAGIGGERSGLWVEIMRAADAIRPQWIFLENVPAIRTRGGEVVLAALRERGYRCRCGTLAAEDVGAPYLGERWWCLATQAATETVQPRLPHRQEDENQGGAMSIGGAEWRAWWSAESKLVRLVPRVPGRVHRLRALGNAQVPLQAALAWVLLGGPVA